MIVGVSEKEKTEKPWHSAYDAYAGATQLYRYFPMELMTDLMSNENASAKRSHLALFIYRLLEQQNKLP